MKKRKSTQPEQQNYSDMTVPAFGFELLREVLIPEILGKETPSILYWCGRSLARKYPLETIDDIADFFREAGWGNLLMAKETKTSMHCRLTSELISKRTDFTKQPSFSLESGFLAQQIQSITKHPSESHSTYKKDTVEFVIEWDHKDTIEDDAEKQQRER